MTSATEEVMTKELSETKAFYVSLTQDLIGYYLVFEADCEATVRQYLAYKYGRERDGVMHWALPWCAVYDDYVEISKHGTPKLIHVRGTFCAEDF